MNKEEILKKIEEEKKIIIGMKSKIDEITKVAFMREGRISLLQEQLRELEKKILEKKGEKDGGKPEKS